MFQLRAQLAYAEFQARVRTLVSKIEKDRVGDPRLWRQLRHLSVIGPAALPPDQLDRVSLLELLLSVRQQRLQDQNFWRTNQVLQ